MASDTLNPTPEQEPAQSADVGEALTIGYQGKAKPIAGIQLKNLLLLIPTIGVYRFWAISRLRRYFWSSLTANGDRLEYTGRGMELFMGLILALLVLMPVVFGFVTLSNLLVVDQIEIAIGLNVIFVVVMVWLGHVGTFYRHRYLMSRTRWRGIRFGLKGSGFSYGFFGLGQFLITILSLSLYTPFATMNLRARIWGNTYIGDHSLSFQAVKRGLFTRYLLIFGSYALGYLILFAFFLLFLLRNNAGYDTAILIFTVVWWLTFFWFIAIYLARIYKNTINSIVFQKISFSSEFNHYHLLKTYILLSAILFPIILLMIEITGAEVQVFYDIMNFIRRNILPTAFAPDISKLVADLRPWVFTGGVTYIVFSFIAPVIIQHRLFRDLVETTTVNGTFNPKSIKQNQEAIDNRGEGLATALGLGGL